jgi:hypothetical protein
MSYDDVPDHVEYRREYLPTPEHRDLYAVYFREFVNLYRRNKGIHHRLNASRRAFRGHPGRGSPESQGQSEETKK